MRAPLVEARKALGDILTDEQKAAREAAMKAAKEAGKKPQEAQKAAEEAPSSRRSRRRNAPKSGRKWPALKTIRDKVMEVLTPEQRAAVEEKMKARRDEAKKSGKKAAEK